MSRITNADTPRNPETAVESSLADEVRTLLRGLRSDVQSLRQEIDSFWGTNDSEDALLTREEAAERLRISTRTLDDLEASGRLQAVRIGRRVLYHSDTLDAYIRSCTGEGRQHA
jgi:excisionase family DNA binding protein